MKKTCKCVTPEHENLSSHGTRYGYRQHCCRCVRCRLWNSTTWRRYRSGDPDRIAARDLEWRKLNREAETKRQREYQLTHRDEVIQRHRRYRARMRSATAGASHHGRYSPVEDAIIMRNDISTLEKACMLDRTYGSVQSRRYYLMTVLKRADVVAS